MSIVYFPTIYEDELLWSAITRFYSHVGYINEIEVAKDLYENPKSFMNREFVHAFHEEAMEKITSQKDWNTIIEKHTMYPYYARFLCEEKRNKAYESLYYQRGNYHNVMPMPIENGTRYFRYCPLCVKEDRERLGETYWHRNHQLIGVNVCPIHKCYLKESELTFYRREACSLKCAEACCIDEEIEVVTNAMELQLASYIIEVFQENMGCGGNIGRYFQSQLEGTKYISIRGGRKNLTLLYEDIMEYYKMIPREGIQESWQLAKLFTNARIKTYEICQLAMFLHFAPSELVKMELPLKSQIQRFDEKVKEMHDQGINYVVMSKQLGVSYDGLKKVGKNKKKKRKGNPKKCGAKTKDWNAMDVETLPRVRKAIIQLKGDGKTRPHKVTEYALCKMLCLPEKSFVHLPRCRKLIQENKETQKQYWIKEIRWAIRKIEQEGEVLNWKHIRELTNMKKKDFDMCKMEVIELRGRNL